MIWLDILGFCISTKLDIQVCTSHPSHTGATEPILNLKHIHKHMDRIGIPSSRKRFFLFRVRLVFSRWEWHPLSVEVPSSPGSMFHHMPPRRRLTFSWATGIDGSKLLSIYVVCKIRKVKELKLKTKKKLCQSFSKIQQTTQVTMTKTIHNTNEIFYFMSVSISNPWSFWAFRAKYSNSATHSNLQNEKKTNTRSGMISENEMGRYKAIILFLHVYTY